MYHKFKNLTRKQKLILAAVAFFILIPILIYIAALLLVLAPLIAGVATLVFLVLGLIKKQHLKRYLSWSIISLFVTYGSFQLGDALFGTEDSPLESETPLVEEVSGEIQETPVIEKPLFHKNETINEVITRLNDHYQLSLTKENVSQTFSFKTAITLDSVRVNFIDNSTDLHLDYEVESEDDQREAVIEVFRQFMSVLGLSLSNDQFNQIISDLKSGQFTYDDPVTVNDCDFSLSRYPQSYGKIRYRLNTRINKSELFKTQPHEYTLNDTDSPESQTPPPSVESTQSVSTETKVHFIDTGHSDSILIENSGQFALIDAGDRDDDAKVKAYLNSQGVKRLEYVIITHFHADHFGGADTVINDFEVGKTLVPNGDADTQVYRDFIQALSNKGLAASVPLEGAVFPLGNATLTLYNTRGNSSNENNDSLVTLLQSGNRKALFTGDAESVVEQNLTQIGDIDLFKAGHHGSKTSNTLGLLNRITPEYVVIMAGVNNKYGHPDAEVMDRFQALGIPVYRTDEQGSIVFTLSEQGVTSNQSPGSYQPGAQEQSSVSHSTSSQQQSSAVESSSSSSNQQQEYFQNCTDLRRKYPNGVPSDHPAYQSKMDRDKDNWACER